MFVFDQALFEDEELAILSTDGGERIARAMGGHNLCVLRNHGLLTGADSVEARGPTFPGAGRARGRAAARDDGEQDPGAARARSRR